MDVIDAILKRRSIRKYLPKKIEFDVLARILDAANEAPSAGNLQSWKMIVVESEDSKDKIAKACFDQLWMNTAAVQIVVCSSTSKIKRAYGVRGEMLYSPQECGMLIQNLVLAAENFGLASCAVSAFDEKELSSVLDIPESSRPQAVITLGYPDEIVPKPAKIPTRDLTYFEKFGKKKEDFKIFPLADSVKNLKKKVGRSNFARKLRDIFPKRN